MREDPRFLVGNHIYRIDPFFGTITHAGNADNHISVNQLHENQHSYNLSIDEVSGKLLLDHEGGQVKNVTIPKTVLDDGYFECSQYAENFNAKLSEKFGIQLVDKAVLKKMEDMPISIPQQVFPIIEQDGFKFEIDVSLNEIRNVDNPFIHLDLDRMEIQNGKYVAYIFDNGKLTEWDQGNDKRFEIDQLVKVAPDDVAKVYGISKDKLPEKDRQLRSNPEFIKDRIERGKLPVIRIVDEDYYVDTKLNELRSCNKFWKNLELTDNGPDAIGIDCKHVYLYDYLNSQIVKNFNELTEAPKHTVFVVLPDFIALDPVAAGRSICKDPYAYLEKYPLQPYMEARIVPIEKTYLAEQIRRNKERKELVDDYKTKLFGESKKVIKPESNSKVIKQGKKNNKGNGLPF